MTLASIDSVWWPCSIPRMEPRHGTCCRRDTGAGSLSLKWRIAVRHEHGERRSRGCGNYQSGNSVAQTGKLAVSGTYAQNTGGALDVTHRGIGGLHAVRPTQRPAPFNSSKPIPASDNRRPKVPRPTSQQPSRDRKPHRNCCTISTCPRIARSGRRSPDQLDRGECRTPAEPVACHEEMRSSGWNRQMPLMRRLEIRAPPSLASRKNRVLWAFLRHSYGYLQSYRDCALVRTRTSIYTTRTGHMNRRSI
jgi:hypothetical protein